jgi:copper transport protein
MRIGIPALLCLALAVCGAGRVAAHAQLVAADPAEGALLAAMPEQVTLHFSEPVAPVTIRWFPPGGEAIEIVPAVAQCTDRLSWPATSCLIIRTPQLK